MRSRLWLLLLFLGVASGALVAPEARADIFALEPGKKIKGHEGIDCDKCHTSGSGIAATKCLGCHEHKPLARRIRAGEGLHGRPDYKAKSCESCHLEHKGTNYNPIDWRPLGGTKRFDHGLTGYDLEGAHKRQDCTKCHTARYKDSNRTKYLGLDSNCLSCHEDVHRFGQTHKNLTDCKICHTFDARSVTMARGLPFDHGKVSKFELEGRHERTKCSNCHTSTTIFKMQTRPDRCVDCHKDPHNNVYTAKGRDCNACHTDKKLEFTTGKFNHGKHTRFDLKNKHARQSCKKCHEPTQREAPRFACATCHMKDSTHVVAGTDRFAGRDCMQCHVDRSFELISFNHGKNAGFVLGGKHGDIKCTDCHRAKPKREVKQARDAFEFHGSSRCIDCHAHGNAHEGKFNDRPQLCTKCHVPGSTNIKSPNHSELSSVFDQQGAHAALSCETCHSPGLTKLKVGQDCSACHADDDVHEGSLGNTCKQCHFEGYPWSEVLFDHNTQAAFQLQGRHQVVSCTKCHTNSPKEFKPVETKCVSCHASQDVHEGKLGLDCDKCHDVHGATPLFDHNTMTDYPLEGAHARADCKGCHFKPDVLASSQSYELDWAFAATGTHCADCHGDPHGLRPGAQCLGCHDVESFQNAAGHVGAGDTDSPGPVPTPDAGPTAKAMFEGPKHDAGDVITTGAAIRDQYHDVPPFSLRGGHSRLECNRCHGGRGDLTSFGQACDTCHRQDDIHAGSLGPRCAECHSIQSFAPARFSHTTVGFPLVGAHRMVSCKSCHAAGNYMGLSGDCVSCHLDDAARAGRTTISGHGVFLGQPCINCHNQVTWMLSPFVRRRF